jgi:putative holliday junction resolvase
MGPLSAQVEGVLLFYQMGDETMTPPIFAPGMGRIMGIDFGHKRTGISVTDPLQIIVQGLGTQKTEELVAFIKAYVKKETVETFVLGYPFLEGAWGDKKFKEKLDAFILFLQKEFPEIPVKLHDERYSSVRAREIILQSGVNKKKRRDKDLLDQTSAVVILQEYLGHI